MSSSGMQGIQGIPGITEQNSNTPPTEQEKAVISEEIEENEPAISEVDFMDFFSDWNQEDILELHQGD